MICFSHQNVLINLSESSPSRQLPSAPPIMAGDEGSIPGSVTGSPPLTERSGAAAAPKKLPPIRNAVHPQPQPQQSRKNSEEDDAGVAEYEPPVAAAQGWRLPEPEGNLYTTEVIAANTKNRSSLQYKIISPLFNNYVAK